MNEPYKRFTIKDLRKAFEEAGYPVSDPWIRRQVSKGNLNMPRSTTNFKKPQGSRTSAAIYELSKEQIDDIVKAFLPGGTGYYSYKNQTNEVVS